MSERQGDFVSRAIAGAVGLEAIDDFVDLWHSEPRGQTLAEFLGMTDDEYSMWLQNPDSLRTIIADHARLQLAPSRNEAAS